MTDQFQTIAAAFAGAVLSQLHRPLRLRWRAQETRFAQWLLVQQVDIEEAWLEGLLAKLTCVSSDPELPLQDLLGQPLGIEMVTDRGALHHTNGIITEARTGQADGALRVYQLTLKDALSIMEERINTRVFRQLSVPRILEIMLGEWRQRSPALATAFHFDLDGLEDRRYPMREISHQFNESDAHFIRRLCRREGIAWYVASPQPFAETGKTADADVPMHTLVFCDQSAMLPRALAGTVRYHRDGATEERDTISAWSRQRSLVPGRVWRGSWDYKAVRVEEAASHSAIDQGDTGRALAAILNDGLIEAPHAADGQQDHLRLADARMLAHEGRSESFEASGTVRDLAVGHWFELEGHPDMHGQDRTLREFIVTSLRQQAENNFPKALQDAIDRLLPASTWQADVQGAADMRYRNQLSCRRRSAPLAPHYDPRLHLPAVHPVTALVVGPANEEVYCDELGRIKVQLQGLHAQDHVHAQGAGTSGQERDSAFVRVSSAWAGAGYGHDAVPRVGMEVLIDFLGGDPDKMFVAGVLHNGINHPARFSHSGGLPGNRFLSGIKSKEIEGARYNQLRLDDTPGQISTQLASEHQHSQMNLGYLTEPRHDGQGNDRGEGLEARTDGHGVLRGAKGILITAQAQDRGRGRMLERETLLDTLHSLEELAQRLSQDAARHYAEATDLAQLERIRKQLQAWDTSEAAGGTRHAAAPMVALDAPAGVSVTSQDTMVLGASRHIDLVILPYWDGDKQSLIDGAKPVKTASLADIKPSPASLRQGRAHIPDGFVLPDEPQGGPLIQHPNTNAVTSGYWIAQLVKPYTPRQVAWNAAQVPMHYEQGESFTPPDDVTKESGVLRFHYLGIPVPKAPAARHVPDWRVPQGVLREIPAPSRELRATGLLPAPATGIWHGRIDPAHPLAKVFNQWNRQAYVEEGQPFPDPRDRGLDISPKEIEWQWLDQANQPLPSGRKAITIRNFSAEEPMAKGS